MTIGIIVAMNVDRVIGVNGKIPRRYPADVARFKRVTTGSTVIMGRKTWESIPTKFRPLPGRRNIVISRSVVVSRNLSVDYPTVAEALRATPVGDVWFIGGARIYAEAMQHADVIDVTWVPWQRDARDVLFDAMIADPLLKEEVAKEITLVPSADEITYFPPIDEAVFAPGPREPHPDDPALALQRFERRYGLKDNEKLRQQGVLRR